MATVIIVKEDCKSVEDGYHFNVWEDMLDSFGLPEDTEEVEVRLVERS